MKSPISYQGSKRKELKYIKEYEPKEFNKLVDVFGGGGSVSMFYLSRDYKVYYNDINEELIELYHILKNENDTKMLMDKIKDIPQTEEMFYEMFDGNRGALRLLYITKFCFRGVINRRMPNKIKDIFITRDISYKHLIEYPKNLINMSITEEDYKIILERYKNDTDAFLYLDPPYISKMNNTYITNFTIEDIIFIRDYFDTCKCKIMIHIDYTGYTRETFNKYYKYGYSVKYGSNPSKDVYTKYHLIATNY